MDGTAKPRVLMVGRPSPERREDERQLRDAGYDVWACSGPEGSPEIFPHGACLFLNGGECPLASGSDAIVFGLPLDSLAARTVLRSYRDTRPDVPLYLRTSDREAEEFGRLLEKCRVVRRTWDDHEEFVGRVGNDLEAEGTATS